MANVIEQKRAGEREPQRSQAGLLTKEEAARFLRVTTRGLEKWMAQRRVPFFRIGKKSVRFKLSDLEAHLEEKCRVATQG